MNGPHKNYLQAQAWLSEARKLQAELSQEEPSRSRLPTLASPPAWNAVGSYETFLIHLRKSER
jgi:hypothetical protein